VKGEGKTRRAADGVSTILSERKVGMNGIVGIAAAVQLKCVGELKERKPPQLEAGVFFWVPSGSRRKSDWERGIGAGLLGQRTSLKIRKKEKGKCRGVRRENKMGGYRAITRKEGDSNYGRRELKNSARELKGGREGRSREEGKEGRYVHHGKLKKKQRNNRYDKGTKERVNERIRVLR